MMSSLTNAGGLSVLQLLNSANIELERVLLGIRNSATFALDITAIGAKVMHAVSTNSDVALASILHNQGAMAYPIRHCVDTAIVALLVASRLKKTPDVLQSIVAAALTMNIGMLEQQYELQDKRGGLTADELAAIKNHPENGVRILREAGVVNQEWLNCVLLHHENEDGTGYPFGKKLLEITQNAKIIALSDRYCARVSAREYRKSLQPEAAVKDMLAEDKKLINPILAACFTKELGIYPIGAFVILKNGETAIVTSRGDAANTPNVHVLRGTSGQTFASPFMRKTADPMFSISRILTEGHEGIKFQMHQLWGADARV